MTCTRSIDDIQALVDGTLGPIRAAELERHLDECDDCRALADDLRRIRDVAETLGDPAPPDHVWLQIAGRLRQEGRVHDRRRPSRRLATSTCGWRSPPPWCSPSARRSWC